MNESAKYVKIVEWLDNDKCFVGQVPSLFGGGCHGDDEREVYAELCEITEEVIDLYHEDGDPMPQPTAGHHWAEFISKDSGTNPVIHPPTEDARYIKIVEWLEEDNCFVGHVPGLFDGGCHGDDEREVYAELCALTEEMIAHYHEQGKPLPPPTAGHDWADVITARVDAELAHHR